MKVVLKDSAPGYRGETTVNVVKGRNGSLEILPEGYGQKDFPEGSGAVIYVSRNAGKLTATVFGDVNVAEATESISLEGAKNSSRTAPAPTEVDGDDDAGVAA
jgi:hypothetical protein